MQELSVQTYDGDERVLTGDVVDDYVERIRGEVIFEGDPDYEDARRIYNAMIDRRPAMIVRCADVADIMTAMELAREEDLLVSVRSGGHSGPGLCIADRGLVIDLSMLRGIHVDPDARTVRVQPGCTWGDVDHATHAFGMATVSGIISTTGVGGLTLGGGHGHLTRKYGLTIDNLLSADVVLADGSFVTASEDQHADLFWALRGGGGNFGIVTSFVFRLHPVDDVVAGPMLWSIDDAATIMRAYRDFLPAAPEDLSGFFTFMKVPPAPNFPSPLHGRTVCGVVWCSLRSQDETLRLIEPMRSVRPPLLEQLVTMPYPAFQSAFDELYPPGMQWYWKGDFVETLSDEAIALHVRHGSKLPTLHSTMHLYPVDGAANRVGASDTAFSYREATWSKVIVGVDPDPGKAKTLTKWARDYWNDLHPHSLGGAYVNFMMGEGPERVRATYRDNYDRLVEIKRRYDPDNFFRMNQNIDPAA